MGDAQWGNVAEWFAAIGTIGAFTIGFILLGRQLKAYKAAEEEHLRDEAVKVSAWWEFDTSKAGQMAPASPQSGRMTAYTTGEWVLRVANVGDSPAYNCAVYIGPKINEDGTQNGALEFFFPIVPPSRTLQRGLSPSKVAILKEDGVMPPTWVEVWFTDSTGRYWRRTSAGHLHEAPGPPPVGSIPPNIGPGC